MFEQKDMPTSQMIPVTGSLNKKKKKEEEKGFYSGTENSHVGLCHVPYIPSGLSVAISFWENPHLRTKSVI